MYLKSNWKMIKFKDVFGTKENVLLQMFSGNQKVQR